MSVATKTPGAVTEASIGTNETRPSTPNDSSITASEARIDNHNGPGQLGTRSCYNCHRRKVGCDKKQPCSNCSRSGQQCVYPPVGRVRRPRKKTMAWVTNRLSQLERLLPTEIGIPSTKQSGPSPPSASVTKASSSPLAVGSTSTSPEGHDQFFADEILMQKGAHSQYFNEILLSRVIEEAQQQQDIQSVLTTPASRREDGQETSIGNPMGILSAVSSTPSCTFFPERDIALKLWNIYCERVESCTRIKVLHLPTDEIKIYAAIEEPSEADPVNLALCFAVFYAALTALQTSEAQSLLGGDTRNDLDRFKAGYEQALAQANILDNPTLTLLSSLAIYLSALRFYNRGKGVWVLHGLAIRIAQAMGIHRDGERLGLSPFQSELRRRLWWHFFGRDSRAAEDYGLQKVCNLRSDVDLPLNVDDADLYPDMSALPPPRPGMTAMTFPLVSYEIARTVHRLASIVSGATATSPPQESVRKQIIDEARERIEMSLKQCNLVIPRHKLALLVSDLNLRKADLVSRQQWLALNHPGSREAFATEENLVEAIEVLEMGLKMWSDEMLKPYRWMWKANPEYHLIMFLLWHLCVRSEGPNVDRAWL